MEVENNDTISHVAKAVMYLSKLIEDSGWVRVNVPRSEVLELFDPEAINRKIEELKAEAKKTVRGHAIPGVQPWETLLCAGNELIVCAEIINRRIREIEEENDKLLAIYAYEDAKAKGEFNEQIENNKRLIGKFEEENVRLSEERDTAQLLKKKKCLCTRTRNKFM
jgi:hypothetical protein